MRKKVGLIKRIFTLLLVVLMSINSFAAIVSDNDGSAFITKAEFDALKSSFQAQIDTYNHSIDSKIDGAIASYLAGVSISSLYYGDLLLDNCSKFRIENNAQLGESERKLPDIDMRIDLENYRRYPEGSSIWFWVIVDYIDIYSRAHNRMKKNIVDVVNATNHDIHIAENDTSTARHYIFKGIIDDWLESYQLVWFGQTEDNWGA